jgi:TnpA family transposase
MNPVRAKMVTHPAQYRWSSYRANAQSEFSHLITPHAQYLSLGDTDVSTAEVYRELLEASWRQDWLSRFGLPPMATMYLVVRDLQPKLKL